MVKQSITLYPESYTIKEYLEYYNDNLIICEKYDANGNLIYEKTPEKEDNYNTDKYGNRYQHGKCKEFFPDGSVQIETNYLYGIGNGETKDYYPNGKIRTLASIVDGGFNGGVFRYYENGNLKAKSCCMNSKQHGPKYLYYENGNIRAIIYDDNFLFDGFDDIMNEVYITGPTFLYNPDGTLDDIQFLYEPIC